MLDASSHREWLTTKIPPGGAILDAGCGWGRDAKAFQEEGFVVAAFDGCAAMAQQASQHLGQPVPTLRFQEMAFMPSSFDGVWARASLLHLEPDEMAGALKHLIGALKPRGWLYACFKEGSQTYVDAAGRYFTNMTESAFRAILAQSGHGVLREVLVTEDQFGRENRWLNVLVSRE